jgi:glycosyltransferase involved in cell wall biosynthesis
VNGNLGDQYSRLPVSMHAPSSPLVSIVTPAYNEEKYIAECVESVLAQSYSNWEYTIVNNCSDDGTLAVAQKYAAEDPRIRVISNTTLLPAVANFNHALRQISSSSKYCKMVLADDWMFPECLERMVAVTEERPSVGIVGAFGLTGAFVLWSGLPYGSNVVSGREACRQRLLGGPYIFGSPTSVLFRADLVRSRDPFFNESNLHAADSEACFELLKTSDFGFVHQVLTFSRERHGSLFQTSRELNASAADILHQLVAYGPFYLTPDEYTECLDGTVSKYYDFLATCFLRRSGNVVWDYHRGKLKENGIGFSWLSLAGAVSRKIVDRFRVRSRGSRLRWGL